MGPSDEKYKTRQNLTLTHQEPVCFPPKLTLKVRVMVTKAWVPSYPVLVGGDACIYILGTHRCILFVRFHVFC